MAHRILICDDEGDIRESLRAILLDEGFDVTAVAAGPNAVAESPDHDALLLDIKMPGQDGLETLAQIRKRGVATPVIMISGHGDVKTAMEAIRAGADDFLEKPLALERVLLTLEKALERSRLARERDVLAREVARQRERLEEEETLLGEGPAMTRLREELRRAGASDARVLITGESGVGKEVAARTLHRLSPRAGGPFVDVNGAAIPEDLIESELFGHVKGSFTGATEDRKGKWEAADGGTLFLDEIGDMSPRTQAKILRAIQDGKISRVGATRTIETDVRIVAATNRDLPKMIAAGTFREDLYFRLAVVPIRVPTLAERPEDIPALVAHFAGKLARRRGRRPPTFSAEALEELKRRPWPGNVRELQNVVERALLLTDGAVVGADDLPGDVLRLPRTGGDAGGGLMRGQTLADARDAFERRVVVRVLEECRGNVSRAAERLGLDRTTLHRRLRAWGLTDER